MKKLVAYLLTLTILLPLHRWLVKSVDWVKCNYESHYGNLISNWKIDADRFKWDVTIPANSTATIYVQWIKSLIANKVFKNTL